MKSWLRSTVSALSLALLASACTIGNSSPATITHSTVPSIGAGVAGSIDVIDIDQQAHRLYAADRTDGGVDVFDASRPAATFLQTIAMPAEPNGLAVAPDLGRVFVGLSDGSLAMVDTRSETLLKTVPTGGKLVDLIDYSPSRSEVFASNGPEGKVAQIDAATGAVKSVFKLGYALEQPRYDSGDRMLYVTSPDAGAIFQVDPDSGQVKRKLKLSGCQARGLAINPRLEQALIACSGWVVRLNLRNATDGSGFTQVAGGDVVTYYSSIDRFLVAAPGVKSSAVGLFGGNPIDYVTAVDTGANGNSAAYDEKHGVVYTPDVRPGTVGVAGFRLPSGELALSISPEALALFAALLAAIIGVMFVIGRLGDPVRRPAPPPQRHQAAVRATRTWTRKA